ncbi:MAG: DEAD/DEAH box helicase [Imperialibacter sp.]|uniref:DEAD/DEAH box helicase n=1 Tax=Imperialibacter sp. TaxID=2038411 RepID=UPI0032EA90FA
MSIRDERIRQKVEQALQDKGFIPEPLIQFNPSFAKGESLQSLADQNRVHAELPQVFGSYNLYKHQVDALKIGLSGQGFIVTSGTGSGKSLTFLATIFNDLLSREKKLPGIKAILVYPMNALINSQEVEIKKYLNTFGESSPISFAKYTGQESSEERERARKNPPDIILTNYMMLELIMTRESESWMRDSLKKHLKYLVFDELHTYRGRQGSDVSLLIRRIKNLPDHKVICIGTSATMASQGTPDEKKDAIIEVAQKIFSADYSRDQIINETLENSTTGNIPSKANLAEAIRLMDKSYGGFDEFTGHPLAIWMENRVALKLNEKVLERGTPRTFSEIAGLLATDTGSDETDCAVALRKLLNWAETLNAKARSENLRKSFLPFRFHQFISQTSTVFVTLDEPDTRTITVEPGRYIKEDGNDILIYPVLFSRLSGVEFLCVEKDLEKKTLLPRNPDDPVNAISQKDARSKGISEELFTSGYLLYDQEGTFWSDEDMDNLPDSWFIKSDPTRGIDPFYSFQIPLRISFDKDGAYAENLDKHPMKGWFLSAKLRIDPTAGVIYEDVKTSENTKLMRLGNEGRSTATTLMAYSVIHSLHLQDEPSLNQKLLSFTDNRQDASLQAGHFNDFLTTIRLRSAVYHALEEQNSLKVYELPSKVFEKLSLDESEYARIPSDLPGFGNEENERALREYLLLRIINDLKKGWRYTLPNLEQSGLLQIDYAKLKEFSELDIHNLELVRDLSTHDRAEFYRQVLDFFRTSYSIYHHKLMEGRAELRDFLMSKLDPKKLWSLEENEKIEAPAFLVSRSPGRTQTGIFTGSMGSRSVLGKYIRRRFQNAGLGTPDQDTYIDFIDSVCDLLARGSFLKKAEIRGDRGTVSGYQLISDAIIWKLGDKETVPVDKVRLSAYSDLQVKPNPFFRELYQRDFRKYSKQIVGAEHTGQLSNEDRIDREQKFRQGQISSLFCSPTMELGIDIADLNIVHMRNVPPNPANYAQRSGRAGRSGQTAVVLTYCSAWSPHDRNYFKNSTAMVAGTVAPPRIDLTNEELLKSHFNAYILMDLGLGSLNNSVVEMIDLSKGLQLKDSIKGQITDGHSHNRDKWIAGFKKTIQDIIPRLDDLYWYSPSWFEVQANSFQIRFDKAFDRWRTLYRNALSMKERAQMVIDDPTVKYSSPEHRDARSQWNVSQKQLALLKNEMGRQFGNESEFYVFRYLAAEGFLPGYNFTRLPVRAFVGWKHQDDGEYISRARFVALKEYGPQNLIYHNGSKYRINRMMLTEGDTKLQTIKISKGTGYAYMDEEARQFNNDPITKTELKGDQNVDFRSNLLELNEVEGVPQDRISCEEEERTSQGFVMEQYFRYVSGMESTRQMVIKNGGQPLLYVIYGPATELIQLNRKWKRGQEDGFNIDKRNGRWLRQSELEDPAISENSRNVMVYARDWADTLYIQPVKDLEVNPDQVKSLSYALKRGIERRFQIEENEIGVWVMGNPESPNIMIYEASEGSLGILSQLINNPARLKELFVSAYQAIHFDPETDEDLRTDLPKASYEDLLSYYNQTSHDVLDRFAIQKPLRLLMDCDLETMEEAGDRQSHYKYLLESYDKNSGTELKLLKHLYENGLRLPTKAQVNMEDYYISVDFVYNTEAGPVLIFCDGSVHDDGLQKQEDQHKRDKLRARGYEVIEWHYAESVEELVKRRKDIFIKVV